MLKLDICFAWNKAHREKVVNDGSQWVKDMKRRGRKEYLKQGDEQNKFIANSVNKIYICVCVCVCVCVSNTTKLQKELHI